MKLTSKNRNSLFLLLFLGFIIFTIAWELLEKVLTLGGIGLDLSLGPIGFDLEVLQASILVNPGSIIGIIVGFIIFKIA